MHANAYLVRVNHDDDQADASEIWELSCFEAARHWIEVTLRVLQYAMVLAMAGRWVRVGFRWLRRWLDYLCPPFDQSSLGQIRTLYEMRFMKLWLLPLLLACLVLSACAPAPRHTPMHLDVPAADMPASVSVKDLRPPTEKESKMFSLLVTSGAYGIERVGDGALDIAMPQAFGRFAYDKLGRNGQPMAISVYHMVVYMNNKAALRASALSMGVMAAVGGAVGGAIAGAVSTAPGQVRSTEGTHSWVDQARFDSLDDEYERAFLTKDINGGKAFSFIIYMDADINGKRMFTKSVVPVQYDQDRKSNYNLAVTEAFQYWLTEFQSDDQAGKAEASPSLSTPG